MSVYCAWSDATFDAETPGPWTALHLAADGLLLIDSDASLSRVYHELKWSLPSGATLFVTAVTSRPKLAHLAAGTNTWLRERVPGRPEGDGGFS